MLVLGINGFIHGVHDPAAALFKDGGLIAAVEEERLIRRKHAFDQIPTEAIQYCLHQAGHTAKDIDVIAFGWNLNHVLAYTANTPLVSIPDEQLLDLYLPEAKFPGLRSSPPTIWISNHHRSHATESFVKSNFQSAAVLVIDGSGEYDGISLFHAKKKGGLEVIQKWPFSESLGIFYQALTIACGFARFQEGKVMGLAPYGKPIYTIPRKLNLSAPCSAWKPSQRTKESDSIREWLTIFREIIGKELELTPFDWEDPSYKMDLAASGQAWLEQELIRLAAYALRTTKESNLVLTGGVALNCVANAQVAQALGTAATVYVSNSPADMGCSIGAALDFMLQNEQQVSPISEPVYTGASFKDAEIEAELKDKDLDYQYCEDIAGATAELLERELIGGWFQGRIEFGPRALGNRSIIAFPKNQQVLDRTNAIKGRERWRPLAPVVKAERLEAFFEWSKASPFMSYACPVRNDLDHGLVLGHVDQSARIQTVSPQDNQPFWQLLDAIENRTGFPVLINTSFNIGPEPIVYAPRHAIKSFVASALDFLSIGNYLITK